MERLIITPRENWQKRVERDGLHFHSLNDKSSYWNESVAYEFTMSEIEKIESVTNELNEMIISAVQYVIDHRLYHRLGIPEYAIERIEQSWNEELPSIYGRFDFGYHPDTEALKLYEFNADTPTMLLESAVIQWSWLQDLHPDQDQFNSIHERLIRQWKAIKPYLKDGPLYFAATHLSVEDIVTVEYLRDTAEQAGLATDYIAIEDIGYQPSQQTFVDLDCRPICNIFKLYPWEWLLFEPFGKQIDLSDQIWIEPTWKMIASNKALLAILWELYPSHPNLLRTEFTKFSDNYCRKPFISREGANVQIFKDGELVMENIGDYGEEGFIYQEFFPLPDFSGHYPMIGSWLIDQQAAGIGIRESSDMISNNNSQFIPHYIKLSH